MKILIITLLSFALGFGALFGEGKKNEEQKNLEAKINLLHKEIKNIQKELDEAQSQRWQKRYEYNEYKTKMESELKEVESKLSSKLAVKNSEEEKIYRNEQRLTEIKGEVETKKDFLNGFRNLIVSKTSELKKMLKRDIPYKIEERIDRLNKINRQIEAGIDIDGSLKNVFDYRLDQIYLSSTSNIEESKLISNGRTVDSYGLRLGTVYYAKSAKNSKESGMYLNTGKIKGESYTYVENLSNQIKSDISAAIRNTALRSSKMIMLPFDILKSPMILKKFSETEEMSFLNNIYSFLKSGGIMMIPLILLLLWAFIIVIERLFAYRKKYTNANKIMKSVMKQFEEGNMHKTNQFIHKSDSSLGRILKAVLVSAKKFNRRDAAEKALEEAVLEEIPELEKRLSTLAVIGGAAPLLGLLGTVTGMIALFETITVYGTNDPKLLAGGISEALITTQAGLIIAVPIMLVHNYLNNRKKNIIEDLQQYSIKVMNKLWPQDHNSI